MHHGGEAEEEHVDAQPDVGSEFLQQDVGWDLKEDVWYEEDDQRIVVEGTIQLKLGGQAKYVGIGNIDSVCARIQLVGRSSGRDAVEAGGRSTTNRERRGDT